MSDLFWLSQTQMRQIEPYFPLSHGVPRVDDQRVISGIIFVIRNGLRWRDAPAAYGPHKTIYNRFVRWSRMGGVQQDLCSPCGTGRRAGSADDRCHASQGTSDGGKPAKKGTLRRCIGRTRGGLNSKLHAVCDGRGRPLIMLLTEGQMSDFKGAALMLDALPKTKVLLADQGYDADWFRNALADRGIAACIPSKKSRKVPIPHDRKLYRQRHRIENMFGKLKDWRRIHTRYDRCAHTFFSAICIAAIVIFWLP